MNGLFVGLCTVDIFYLLNNYPKSNTKNKGEEFHLLSGGPSLNGIITFNHLGGKGVLLSRIGKNPIAKIISTELKQNRVKILDIEGSSSSFVPMISSIISTRYNGHRTIFSSPASESFSIGTSAKELDELCKNADFLYFDGYYMDLAKKIVKIGKRLNKLMILDCGSWRKSLEEIIPDMDICLCSDNFSPPSCYSKDEVFNFLSKKGVKRMAITRGAKPILFYDSLVEKKGKIGIEKINAVDTLGAGDIFQGAFCYYYLKKEDFQEALKKASIVATKSCKYIATREWMTM